tara:strand:- start:3973 stop:4614 length:642 start_codon:yes stop_codon:yes gene_type:complete
MGRALGARAKISRAVGMDLDAFGPSRSFKDKCKNDRRPGKAIKRTDRSSDFGKQLEMKKAISSYYGVRDKQFRRFVSEAERLAGSTPENLLTLLESRLDNVIYRMGFAVTRREARQLVTHKKVILNGVVHKSPSTLVSPNDTIEIVEKAKSEARILHAVELSKDIDSNASTSKSEWLDVDYDELKGKLTHQPLLDLVMELFKPSLVIEFYSKS